MTDLPLPAYVPLPEPDGYFKNGSAAFWAEPNMHAYAAAKTAELQAECASHKRIADLCMDAARMSCAERDEARAECARLRANIEAAARYGWEHPSWEWSAVKGGLDRFTDAALRGKETP